MIVYDKKTGNVVAQISNDQNYLTFFHHYSEEFKRNLDSIIVDEIKGNIRFFKVENNKVIKKPLNEIDEIIQWGRVLSNEERLLNQLNPTIEEINKAEQTIELLTLLQEVLQ